jgi:hypothetical protein
MRLCWRSHKYELLQFVWYWITTQQYFKRKRRIGVHFKITGMQDFNSQGRQK